MAIRRKSTAESNTNTDTSVNNNANVDAKPLQQKLATPTTRENKKHPLLKQNIIAFILGGVISSVAVLTLSHGGYLNPEFKIQDTFLAENGASVIASTNKHGLSAHIVQSDENPSDRIAVFTTQEGDIIMGNVLNKAGESIFSDFIQKHITSPVSQNSSAPTQGGAEQVAESGYGQMIGDYQGELPEVIKFIDGLRGYKEDPEVAAADTLYVIYDPRCPYCHKFFEESRDLNLKAKGLTIKWLPTLALGEARAGTDDEALAVAGLTLDPKKEAKAFAETFNKNAPNITVTDEHRTALLENTQFLLDASESQGISPAVPTAFYLDKRTGKPRVVVSPGDAENLKMIFGE